GEGAVGCGGGPEFPELPTAADPSRRPRRQLPAPVLQPFVKFHRASAHVGVRVARHFQIARAQKNFRPPLGTGNLRVVECHGPPTPVEEWKLNKAIAPNAQAQSRAVAKPDSCPQRQRARGGMLYPLPPTCFRLGCL